MSTGVSGGEPMVGLSAGFPARISRVTESGSPPEPPGHDSSPLTADQPSREALWQEAGMKPCKCGCGTLVRTEHRRKYVDGEHRLRAWAKREAAAQRVLPGESRVERAFREWIVTPAGRYVEAQVTHLALEDKRAGDRRGEINLYLALVRRSSRALTKDREGYVCNNSHRSLLARRLMARVTELAGFFAVRELRGRVA